MLDKMYKASLKLELKRILDSKENMYSDLAEERVQEIMKLLRTEDIPDAY